jgi:hypothetical protein
MPRRCHPLDLPINETCIGTDAGADGTAFMLRKKR